MNPQLIEQIKQGTPLEYDIDNLELLRKVLKEAAPNDRTKPTGDYKYYIIKWGKWCPYENELPNSIPLSSFLEPKMVEVHEKHTLMEFLDYCKKGKEVGLTIETSLHDALLNFLNQQ